MHAREAERRQIDHDVTVERDIGCAEFASRGRKINTSVLALVVVDPAAASASMSVISPVMAYFPGDRTSPTTKMLRLRYCSTSTVTCAYRM